MTSRRSVARVSPADADGAVDGLEDVAHRVRAGPARGAELVVADRAPGDVGDRGEDPGRGHVEGHDVGGVGVHGVQLGARAGPAVGVAAGDDQPGVGQPGEQLGGGGLGEAGQLAELGARQRPVLEEQVERGPVVDAAEQAGGPGVHEPPPGQAELGRGREDRGGGHVEGGLVGLPGAHVVDVAAAPAVEGAVRRTRAAPHLVLEATQAALEVAGAVRAVDHRAQVGRGGQVGDLVLHAAGVGRADADHRADAPRVAAEQPGAHAGGEAVGSGACR